MSNSSATAPSVSTLDEDEISAPPTYGPVVEFQRELAAKNHGDCWQTVALAAALYARALTDKRQSPALLREAAAKMAALPASMRELHDVRRWRGLISAADRGT